MSKFFVKPEQIKNDNIIIDGDDVNHILNVLRMKKDDEIQVCNQVTGENYKARIVQYSKNEIECKIEEKIGKSTESNVHITLFQGIPKFEKMELIIQKNTEVGVNNIVPVIMERTVVKLDEKVASKKLDRWQKIAEIAAKQSMRDIIPNVKSIIKTKEIDVDMYDVVLVAYENEEHNMLKAELKKLESQNKQEYNIAIVIGPEGGISEKEIELLDEKNVKFVSLGKRILRTETVALNILSVITYELEQ